MKNGMKQTEIGEIPVEWEVVALQDIAQRVKTKDAGGEHEVLTISAKVGFVRQEDRYSRYMAGESVKNYTLLKQGQFSYNKGNSLTYPFGCIYRLDSYAQALVPNVYISFELTNAADDDFCRHLFLEGEFIGRLKPFITSGVRGNGLLNVNAEYFFSLKLALPPLPEQRKIAEILSTLDEKMAVMDEQLVQTQELKKGLMQRLLTKGIGHTQFKDSPLGDIPVSWEVKQMNEVTSYADYRGKTPPKVDSGVFLVTAKNVRNGKIDYSLSQEYVPAELYDSIMSRGKPAIGDVLITTEAPLGEVASIDREDIALAQRIIKYRANPSVLDGAYFKYALLSPQFQEALDKESTGSTVKGIKGSRLHKMQLLIPKSLPEQRQIAEILTTVDEKIGVLQDKKAQYHTLKKGLMQQLLTGQRRVRVATPEVAELV